MKKDKNELITDDIDLGESLMETFVSISKTIAASIKNLPFTTDGNEGNRKSLFSIQLIAQKMLGLLKISKSMKNLAEMEWLHKY